MTLKEISKSLENSLIHDNGFQYELYKYELEELTEEFKASLRDDNDDYIFAVSANDHEVAMVLIGKSMDMYINDSAKNKLQELWNRNYIKNTTKLIPVFAKLLHNNEIAVTGVKVVDLH
ncbi:hypothetical protein F6R98_17405 [Candidatus Methylospira mobilis]|uniref:Uncharacterized protein n=1 Tax=Candidatus Methylospira mobilis TaxID=1808979 RepID=A0A5Q0BK55_9GAMM|nr:hypothetical protein [Candidatus Methylospira mobilis]QFY44193.1 hypothetical protein F6R98_17405 [Candidatus Methylospira mobilis]WNV06382.1 hypothetical protein RP726_08240 [Candidatus Methylospira mobilis]